MGTYLDHAKPGRADPEAIGETLKATLLKARNTLPLGLNGKPIAPADPYAAKVAQEMAGDRSQEWKRIYALSQCLLLDHDVPVPLVTAPLKQMITMLEVEAAFRYAPAPVTLRELELSHINETRKQCALDVIQVKLHKAAHCPVTLADAMHAGAQYLAAYHEWYRVCVALRVQAATTRAQVNGPRLHR